MMDAIRRIVSPEAEHEAEINKAYWMTFEQFEPGKMVLEHLRKEVWDRLIYHPEHDIMMMDEGKRQLFADIERRVQEARKGVKAVEVKT